MTYTKLLTGILAALLLMVILPQNAFGDTDSLQRDYDAAKKRFEEQANEENTIWFGRRAAYLGRMQEAVDIFTKGLRQFPKSYRLLRHRGHRFISLRKFDNAIADLKKAAELSKKIGIVVEKDGAPNRYNIPVSNTGFNIHYHLGLAYYLKGEYRKAIGCYRHNLSCYSPNNDCIISNTHWLYLSSLQLGEADQLKRELANIKKEMRHLESAPYLNTVLTYKGETDPMGFIKERSKHNAALLYGVAVYLKFNGNPKRAVETLRYITENKNKNSFGFIAAEQDLKRLKQHNSPVLARYRHAEEFHRNRLKNRLYFINIRPNWINGSSRFWYRTRTRSGDRFFYVDPKKRKQRPAFSHQRLASSLSSLTSKKIDPDNLPFDRIKYEKSLRYIRFNVGKSEYRYDLKKHRVRKADKKKPVKKGKSSPDKRYLAYIKENNLYLKSLKDGQRVRLTEDGTKTNSYGLTVNWYYKMNESDPGQSGKLSYDALVWSPDSKRLLIRKTDLSTAKKLYLYQPLPKKGYRANVWSYYRSLPGEKSGEIYTYYIADVEQKKITKIGLPPLHSTIAWGLPSWTKDGKYLTMLYYDRGYKRVRLSEIDPLSGQVTPLIDESSSTYIDTANTRYRILKKRDRIVWSSERDGYNHLYLIDSQTGKTIHQITKGKFVVRDLVHIDEKRELIYFTAGGMEQGKDPYFRYFYMIRFDGSGLTKLSKADADHQIYLSPDKRFYVEKYSRVDLPTVCTLKRLRDGCKIMTIAKADARELLKSGWTYPQRFSLKGRDGKTNIYGVIFKPSHFDPSKKYPILDATYTGPQAVRTPKTFERGCLNSDIPIAELGFIVVTVDGLGTAQRSKAFHSLSYNNLADTGSADHMKAIRHLARKYPYFDIDRVGIYGHSAGGYDAARAIMKYPDFYKVAVSSAGNHDLRMAKAWWPEHYLGLPKGDLYEKNSNLALANKLEGKLLLATGDMDNNVNPACTLRLAAELVKAGKDFELVIIPNADHGSWNHPYFTKRMWNFLVRHLLKKNPPENYRLKLE